MSPLGISLDRLEEIRERLAAAAHRPWVLDRNVRTNEGGRATICKGSRKSEKKAHERGDGFRKLFDLCPEASEAMANFVAHSPEDIEDLLDEVERLRASSRGRDEDCASLRHQVTSLRAELSELHSKHSSLKRKIRQFGQLLVGRE